MDNQKSQTEIIQEKEIVKPLLEWFEKNARVLPWRENPQAYRVWVSEIMLQQTRVEAVKPYYERFMTELPDVKSLANASEDVILKLWEGLGYYNRVRNMQKAAQKILSDFQGVFPSEYADLLTLPGIGSYTAGAIASIAYHRPVPAVDGNVLRVLSRVWLIDGDISKQSVKKEFEQRVQAIIPVSHPGTFNQALMELGALVCIPNAEPVCAKCPLSLLCKANRTGQTLFFPKTSPKKKRRIEEKTVLVIQNQERIAIRKRKANGLLAGLYEFPNLDGNIEGDQVLEWTKQVGFTPLRIQKLPDEKHIFSHIEWHMNGYLIWVADQEQNLNNQLLFADINDARSRYPIPSAFAAYAKYIGIEPGAKGEMKIEHQGKPFAQDRHRTGRADSQHHDQEKSWVKKGRGK